MTSPKELVIWNKDSDPWRLMRDGSLHMQGDITIGEPVTVSARWTGIAWATREELWDAPDLLTAQRWADEINGRGGQAEVATLFSNLGAIYRVIVTRNPYGTSSKLR